MSKLVLLPAPVVAPPADQVIVANELVTDGYSDIPLWKIRISKTNRQRFNLEALHELAASIKEVGIVQPILLRPVQPTDAEPQVFEIVAGERRFRAAVLAGIPLAPSNIKLLRDEQALRIQLLENVQREDPHPLEEAEGYQQLMLTFGLAVEQIMETVHQSRTYVYNRIKLCSLCTAAREAFFDGLLTAETAQLIARIPNPQLQAQAVSEVTVPTGWRQNPGPMTYREARDHIRRNFTLNLQTATFPIKDASLTEAGSCIQCPKRAGNQVDFEGGEASADVCTDPACFADKRGAQQSRERAEAKNEGIPIIAGEQARKIMPRENSELKGGYADLDKTLYLQKGGTTTYRKLLGKQAPVAALLEQPHDGKLLTIARVDEIEAALIAAGKAPPETQHSRNQAQKEREKQEAAAAKIEREYRRRLFSAVRAAATPELTADDVRSAALALLRQCSNETLPFIATIYGWDASHYEGGHDGSKYLTGSVKMAKLVEALDVEQAAVLIRDLMWASDLIVHAHTGAGEKPSRLLAIAAQFNVNAAQIRKDVKRDAEAKEAAKKKPVAKSKPTKAALPAQMEIQTAPETDMASAVDASLAAAMAGEILPMREFIEANPDRINELATEVIAQRPDLVGQLKYVAAEMDFAYSDGAFKRAEKSGEKDEESPPPAPRPKLQVKAKPPAPKPSGPIIKKKKNRAVEVPPNGDLPAGMEFPE